MKKEYRMIFLFFILAGFLYLYVEDQKREATLEPIKKSIIASQRPLILHFYSNSNATSNAYDPVLRKTLIPYENTIECRDLSIDKEENLKLLHNCGELNIPTTVIFDRHGNRVATQSGFLRQDELDAYVHKAVSYR